MGRNLKFNYNYQKVTKQETTTVVDLDEFCKTKDDYKCVLSLLINVLNREHNIAVDEIKCTASKVSIKVGLNNDNWNIDINTLGIEGTPNLTEYVVNRNDILESE